MSLKKKNMDWTDEEYSSASEFIQNLNLETALAHEKLKHGYVLWRSNEKQQQQQNQIIALLKGIATEQMFSHFWGVVKKEGNYHHLSSSHRPFCVGKLKKGLCRYRKLCRDYVYVVDMEGGDEEQLSCVGRAYRSKHLVSSPDLRLYSIHELPMRDDAARCGFLGYIALPLYDLHTNQYFGVLELMFDVTIPVPDMLSSFDQSLKIAGLRSTHSPIYTSTGILQQLESEITDVIRLAMATVPRLYLAQVWVPCKQCVCVRSNIRCMEMAYIENEIDKLKWWNVYDYYMSLYIQACKCYRLQIDVRSCQSNLCDVSISRNPLAHFARRARVSHCFPIIVQSVTDDNRFYVFQFFLQPKFRRDAYSDYSPQLLSRILAMNLKSFKILDDSQKPKALGSGSIDSLNVLMFYEEKISESNFTSYMEMAVDSCCLRPPSLCKDQGWVFCLPSTEGFSQNDVKSNSLLIKEKIEMFLKNMAVGYRNHHRKWIIQFWAPKMEKGKCHLEAFDQPFAVGCLARGIASYRKKCMRHYYLLDDEAKDEELGPPSRVFRNGFLEISPGLFHYTEKEFPIRSYAMHCLSRQYFALPIFDDEYNHKCVGVLEFIGFRYLDLKFIRRELEVAKLCSTHIDFLPRFLANEPQPVNIDQFLREKHPSFLERLENVDHAVEISLQPDAEPYETKYCRTYALAEINNALKLIRSNVPQLHMANVWVPNGECFGISSNMICLELALSTSSGNFMPTNQVHWIHVQMGRGLVGMLLVSENKSCFCRNLCEFSIVDQPLSHFEMNDRRNVCFSICLQSSHTGNIVYVMEFFLYPGPATCEYVGSFLNFLLPIMKNEIKSFKMACGEQLGEELVVEVIEVSEADALGSSESEQLDVFPIKFKSVQYNQKKLQQHTEEQHTKECNLAASDSNKRERGEGGTGLHLSLGVGRSTIKCACTDYDIDRSPSTEEHKKTLSLFGRESGGVSQQETNTESSQHAKVQEEAEKMIIKVKHEQDIIKFEFCLSLGLTKIIEEVASRLNLEIGSFKLKYLDEDGDEILLTRDNDLLLCPKSLTATGKACIQLLVRL